MRYVYFTKMLRELDLKGIAAFCTEVGMEGVDLAVRPGYPVTPANVVTALPEAAKVFQDAGLVIGLVSLPTDAIDPEAKTTQAVFDACGKVGVPAVKIGYFPYRAPFDETLKSALRRMAGFVRLSEKTKTKACYHTHSGNNLGNNAASLRWLLNDLDPHHVGAFVDTGHTAVNGGPIATELDILRPWLSLLAIKDMLWSKGASGWSFKVVPAGSGIVRWADVGKGVKACKFNGTVSVHGEYETSDLAERKKLAKEEVALLNKHLG
jgi:sugar phosphate isomerase/epimerase